MALLPVPKRHLQAYRRLAQKSDKIWREHGALEFRECAGDDLYPKGVVPFARRIKLKRGETVVCDALRLQADGLRWVQGIVDG